MNTATCFQSPCDYREKLPALLLVPAEYAFNGLE